MTKVLAYGIWLVGLVSWLICFLVFRSSAGIWFSLGIIVVAQVFIFASDGNGKE